MKQLLFAAILALMSDALLAGPNFVSNPLLPYPPGCARTFAWNDVSGPHPQAVKVFDEEVNMYDSRFGETVPFRLAVHRSPCADPGRSLIWISFILTGGTAQVELPIAVAETPDGSRKVMALVVEPGGWAAGAEAERGRTYMITEGAGIYWYYTPPFSERRWTYLLDNAPWDATWGEPGWLTAAEYNGPFKLVLRYPPYDFLTIDVPAAADSLLQSPKRLPFSGRQSGVWVVDGVPDQGFQLSVSESLSADQGVLLVLFFSHYTFDTERRPLWVVGNAEFRPGAARVTVPVFSAVGGAFRGNEPVSRLAVGQVMLTSRNCNDIELAYDYHGVGLGMGTRRLQRLHSLETAGYDCRDHEARQAANR